MIRWYQPLLLLRIGVRALLATVVGQIVDNRELQAMDSRDQTNRWDFTDRDNVDDDGLWIDFIADTGDGWASSFAVASAAARAHIDLDGTLLPRADLMLMGGDLVYPDPSRKAYQDRMIGPYAHASELAFQSESESESEPDTNVRAELFAVPGNHDWYDGLHAFQDIFCHDHPDKPQWPLGLWRKSQSHSYFYWQLPGGWWLLAPDVQLDNRINPAQRRYFDAVAEMMQPGDRVIIVAPQPYWTLLDPNEYGAVLRWFADLCDCADVQLKLVLTGDLHHYARYGADQKDEKGSTTGNLQLVTAGGGGAFLHPTHTLADDVALSGLSSNLDSGAQEETTQKFTQHKVYPGARTSRRLSMRNLLFPILNWQLSMFVAFVYTMLAWVLETRQFMGNETVSQLFESVLMHNAGIGETLNHVITTIPKSPEFALVVLLTALGLTAFNENCKPSTRLFLGALHTALHLVGLIVTFVVAVALTDWVNNQLEALSFSFFWFLALMTVLGGGVGGVMIGVYLILSLNFFGANMTNAFSSLRIASYKNFLRLKITNDGDLTLYPLGIDEMAGESSKVHAIEPPIVIR